MKTTEIANFWTITFIAFVAICVLGVIVIEVFKYHERKKWDRLFEVQLKNLVTKGITKRQEKGKK